MLSKRDISGSYAPTTDSEPIVSPQASGPELQGKSLLIFNDGLRNLSGHWYEYDRATADLHRERGVRVTIICNRQFAEGGLLEAQGVEVLTLIERSVWSGNLKGKSEWRIMLAQSLHYARILRAHLSEHQYDLVFVPNALIYDAIAWMLLWRERSAAKVGRLALLFRFSVAGGVPNPAKRLARKFAAWRAVFRTFRTGVKRGRVVFLTDSSRLAKEYGYVAGIDLQVIPSPRTIALIPPASRKHTDAVTFGMLGYATWTRGIDRFEDAVRRLVDAGQTANMRFLIQRSVQVADPEGRVIVPGRALTECESIAFITETMSSQDYELSFKKLDCMVLPYRRAHYHSQISGVAVEAACAGIPMIYTADTWMSDFVAEQGAGIAVPDGDVEALADSIRAIAADYSTYRARAIERSAVARARNSPEEFARVLWGAGPNRGDVSQAP